MRLSKQGLSLAPSQLASFFEKVSTVKNAKSLAIGEFNEPTAQHILTSTLKVVAKGDIKYTPAAGLTILRRLIAEKHNCNIDNVAIGAGSKPLLSQTISLLTDPGDTVVIPTPCYPYYVSMAEKNNGSVVCCDTSKHGFRLNISNLQSKIKPVNGKSLLILNSPNNPTGVVHSKTELEGLANLASNNNMLVLVDNAYSAIIYDGSENIDFSNLHGMAEQVVSIYSFSKEYNMTGFRVGYAIGPTEFIAKLKIALSSFEGCASFISQKAAIAALTGPQDGVRTMVEKLNHRRKHLTNWLDEKGIYYAPPKGAFYIFAKLPGYARMGSESFACALLEATGIIVTPGTAFGEGLDGYVRISYAAMAYEDIDTSIVLLENAMEKLRR